MNGSVIAFTAEGAKIARKVGAIIDGQIFVREKDCQEGDLPYIAPLADWANEQFQICKVIVFIGAVGIAVRAIAPLISSKAHDPAVICIDEKGEFIIPILSGHLGGANSYAHLIAKRLGATPVITTASDVRGSFSIDDWAREQGLLVHDPKKIVCIASALLDRQIVGMNIDAPFSGALAKGFINASSGKLGVCISPYIKSPFDITLNLIPKAIILGLGCKRGTDAEHLEGCVLDFLDAQGVSLKSIKKIASIDLKANEAGIISLCKKYCWDFETYTASALLELNGDFTNDEFVKSITGVDCVCERAAAKNGKLLVKKTIYKGMTIAMAIYDWRVGF